MNNKEVVRVLVTIADLLEIKGENPFRVRSYRNAAATIDALSVSLELIAGAEQDRLEDIPGVGKAIHGKIIEVLDTGSCRLLEELREELPGGLLDMLAVPGLGPKKVRLFYRSLGIDSVDALERAALAAELRALPGMGEKSEQKILRSIERYRRTRKSSKRFRLGTATAFAGKLVEYLSAVEGVASVDIAGSLRRWCESVGDIDILVTGRDGAVVMDAVAAYPGVTEVIGRGDTKSSVLIPLENTSIQVDVRFVEASAKGAALNYFTGSKEHGVALRSRAKKMGLKLSEYGVFDEATGRRVAGKDEGSVYKALGLLYIEPELRENRGEIEAAEKGELPTLINEADIRGNLHMHTTASDGANTVEEMARAAIKEGYEYIAITDHSKASGIAGGLDEKRLLKHINSINSIAQKLKDEGEVITLLKGVEVDILSAGALDYSDELLSMLDCVVGAVHSGFDMEGARMTARITSAIESDMLNILAHPTGRLIGAREPYDMDIEAVMEAAAAFGVAMELNSYPERLDLKDTHCRMAREKGLLVSISTDSHSTETFSNMTYGVHTARRGWLEKGDVLNTRPLKSLLGFFRKGA
ncbi:DNA polymerase X family [hydrothermal vent metagenome]|uniref:DNA polymerase beta n=1 Tax=hydrothermal vent metagenome TaxID=652676 RepID=A0A3B0RQ88_9ZZZZ